MAGQPRTREKYNQSCSVSDPVSAILTSCSNRIMACTTTCVGCLDGGAILTRMGPAGPRTTTACGHDVCPMRDPRLPCGSRARLPPPILSHVFLLGHDSRPPFTLASTPTRAATAATWTLTHRISNGRSSHTHQCTSALSPTWDRGCCHPAKPRSWDLSNLSRPAWSALSRLCPVDDLLFLFG